MVNFAFSFQKCFDNASLGGFTAHLKEVSVVAEDIELTY